MKQIKIFPWILFSLALQLATVANGKSAEFFDLIILDQSIASPWLKAVGDLDGDGRTDIIVGGANAGGLVSYLNNYPDWKRAPIDKERTFSTDGEAADVDGDGRMDFIALTYHPEKGVIWYRNMKAGWKSVQISNEVWHDIEIGDLDGDGLLDLVGRNQKEWPNGDDNGNRIHLLWQKRDENGEISWESGQIPCPAGEGLLLHDIDTDGDPDILLNGLWIQNCGNRNWSNHAFAWGSDWSHPNAFVAAADINDDGRDDILLSPSELEGGTYKVAWFEAPADRTALWTAHTIDPEVETVLHYIGAADFDSDGRVDAVTAEMPQGEDPDEITIHFNRGKSVDGQWTDLWEPVVISENGSHSMRILDANSDGRPDLFGANWRAKGQDEDIKLWINKMQRK